MCFWTKKVKTQQQQQNKISNIKTLAGAGDWNRDSCTQSGCVTTAPPSQLSLSIVVKPFNCFDAMGRNVNKQSQICGPDIFNKYIFLQYFYMHEQLYLAVSHIYGSRFRCLNMVKMSDVNNSDLKDTDLASLRNSAYNFFSFRSFHALVVSFKGN